MVIVDGSLPSVVATAIAVGRRGELPVLWSLAGGGGISSAIESLATAFSLERIEAQEPIAPASEHDRLDRMLVAAGHAAVALGCGEILWPVQPGGATSDGWPDLEGVAGAVDRALLISRLVSLAAGERGLVEFLIDTPLVDLTDEQVAELAVDLAAPVELCWWWGTQDPAGQAEAQRWQVALERVGWRAPAPA